MERHHRRLGEGLQPTLVLYLPVGVGKTFIALRWLLEQLEDGAFGVFLAPNEWIQRSVGNDLALIAQVAWDLAPRHEQPRGGAEELLRLGERIIRIRRPSEIHALPGTPGAVIADECHNWSPRGRGTPGYYTWALNELRGTGRQVPTLGLSATPCRVEVGKYVVRPFVHAFRGDLDSEEPVVPDLTLREAVEQRFLSRPDYRPLAADLQPEVRRVLAAGRRQLVAMGDYSPVTLRQVWEVLARDPASLAREIVAVAERHGCGRGVIFIPPVTSEATNPFVFALQASVARRWGTEVFDFRSSESSGSGARETFERFRNAPWEPGRPPLLVTIDRFGEGVSINDLDLLVMLRATLSPRVAVQALGRGLRLDRATGKTRCLVLDAVLFRERLDEWDRSHADDGSLAASPLSAQPEPSEPEGGGIDLLACHPEDHPFQDVPEPKRWALARALLVNQLRPLLERLELDAEGARRDLEWRLVHGNEHGTAFTLLSAEEGWLERAVSRSGLPGQHGDRLELEQRLEAWLFDLEVEVDRRWIDPGRATRLLDLLTEAELRALYRSSGFGGWHHTYDRSRAVGRMVVEASRWGLIAHLLPSRLRRSLESLLGSQARMPGVRRSRTIRRWLAGIEPSAVPEPAGLFVIGDLLYTKALSLVLERLGLDSSGHKPARISRLENWKGTVGQLLDALGYEDFERLVFEDVGEEEGEFTVFKMACSAAHEQAWSDLQDCDGAADLFCSLISDVDLPRFVGLLQVDDGLGGIREMLASGEVYLELSTLVGVLTDGSLTSAVRSLGLEGRIRNEMEQDLVRVLEAAGGGLLDE